MTGFAENNFAESSEAPGVTHHRLAARPRFNPAMRTFYNKENCVKRCAAEFVPQASRS